VFSGLRKQGRRVVLCGDSAGGNLVAGLCVRLQSKGEAQALGQVLIYPGLGGDRTQGSYISNANAAGLTTKDCDYYFTLRGHNLPPDIQDHPEMRPLLADDLSGTPPTLVITADLDPLRDDGVQYAKRLQDLKLVVQYRNEPELIHGYLRARHISKRAANSVDAIARGLLQMAKEEFV
jgi:acetyl esterase